MCQRPKKNYFLQTISYLTSQNLQSVFSTALREAFKKIQKGLQVDPKVVLIEFLTNWKEAKLYR